MDDKALSRRVRAAVAALADAMNDAEKAGLKVESVNIYRAGDGSGWNGYTRIVREVKG